MTEAQQAADYRSGFIGIFGQANAGKSTLINALVGTKISIVSPKPQTTRRRVLGVRHRPDSELIFVDTPGVFQLTGRKRGEKLEELMKSEIQQARKDVDIALEVVDAKKLRDSLQRGHAVEMRGGEIVVLNKIDLIEKGEILPLIAFVSEKYPTAQIFPMSALESDGVKELEELLAERLPVGPRYFPDETITDQSDEFFIAEVVREKFMLRLRDELPYELAVVVERLQDEENRMVVDATVFVAKESQKGIVVGAKGSFLRDTGTAARKSLEHFYQVPVRLNLFVKVEKNWTESGRALARFGYETGRG